MSLNLRPTAPPLALSEAVRQGDIAVFFSHLTDIGRLHPLAPQLISLAIRRAMNNQPLTAESFLPMPNDERDWQPAIDALIQAGLVAWVEEGGAA